MVFEEAINRYLVYNVSMNWILVALVAPLLWSLLNHVDKYLISKYAGHSGVGGLAIFSSLFAVFALPVVYLIDGSVFDVTVSGAFALILSGIFFILGVFLYLHALKKDDASHVVPFLLLTPVCAYILGIFFLDEYIAGDKIFGSLIALVGAVILSLEFDRGIRVKKATTVLMISSCVSLAIGDTIFKFFSIDASFWQSIFWNQVGFVIFGLTLLLIRSYRKDFISVCKANTKQLVALNLGGEIVQTVATVVNFYAMILAPIALVLLVNYTTQPLFVFIEGLLITKFFPKIAKEHLSKRHVAQKLVSIAIMSAGIYLILV